MAKTQDVVTSACAMIRVAGDRMVTLYKGALVPVDADPDHVELLRERGMVADGEPATGFVDEVTAPPFEIASSGRPAKSGSKADWAAYAVTQGATQEDADAATRDDLIAAYGEV